MKEGKPSLYFLYNVAKKTPKVFSLWDELAQKLALFLNVFSEGVTICITYIEIA